MATTHTHATTTLSLLLDSFPRELCAEPAPAAHVIQHLRSREFRDAPPRARAATLALATTRESSEHRMLDDCLEQLYEALRQRSASRDLLIHGPSAQQVELLRALFVCAVLLLDAALTIAPPQLVARHAELALASLARIASGAVAMTQLAALESRLLSELGQQGRLTPVLLHIRTVDQSGGHTHADQIDAHHAEDSRGPACALALRWVSVALSHPSSASQLWASLPMWLDDSTHLVVGAAGALSASAGESAAAGVCAGVLHAALGSLSICDPEQRDLAAALVVQLGERCAELMRDDAARAAVRGITASATSTSARATMLCALLFGLLPVIKEPLLPTLLDTARGLVLGTLGPHPDLSLAAAGARCAVELRSAVTATVAGARKQVLIHWLCELRGELMHAAL